MRTRLFISFMVMFASLMHLLPAQTLEKMREQQNSDVSGKIVGRVIDENTKEGLPSVNILVKGTYYGA